MERLPTQQKYFLQNPMYGQAKRYKTVSVHEVAVTTERNASIK